MDMHDHWTSSLKHMINQTSNHIVYGALMFVSRVAVILEVKASH